MAFDRAARLLRRRPAAGLHQDTPARARWVGGAKVITTTQSGFGVATDLPDELGGAAEGPSPGWLVRAGLASCLATCIAVLAAREAVELTELEVEAGSRSDVRGIVGVADVDGAPVDPGPAGLVVAVRSRRPVCLMRNSSAWWNGRPLCPRSRRPCRRLDRSRCASRPPARWTRSPRRCGWCA